MEDIIDIIVTETTNLIEITSQPTDEIIDVNIIDNREDVTLNVTPSLVEININSLTGNFGVEWGDITGTLADQTDLNTALGLKADLVGGKVPSSQLPSYVDDIVEVANYSALPATGETGKIYVVLDTNKIYRWSGSAYIEIADSTAVWGAITGTLSSQTDLQNALNAKVPYTGATGNVNLGEYGATVGYLGFDTTPSGTPTGIGTMYWDSANRTVSLIDGDGDTTLQLGQEERVLVHNNTGSTLTDGQVVYVTGSTGELPSVALAVNTSDSTSSVTFGIVTESIAHGADGFITTSGIVHGLNTNAFTEGSALWLGSTAGTFTETKPVAPAHAVLVGYVIKKSGGNGSIFVKIQNGYELDELHDVLITSKANNDGLFYESSSGLWKNKSIATVLGYTPVQGTGDTGYYARWTSAGVLSDGFIQTTSNITYVEGMGLSTLNGLDITGNYGAGGGGLKIRSYDETTGKAYMEFFNTSGNFRLGLEGSTGGGILPGSTAYATVLTTGLTAKNLEFGTNNTKRLTLDGTTGAATFTSTISATGATLTGALSGTSATFSSTITGSRNDNTTNVSVILQNSYINAGNLINFVHNSGGSTTNGYIGHGGDSTGNFVIINNAINALSLARATGAATFSSSVKIGKFAYTDFTYRTLYVGSRAYDNTYSIVNMNPYQGDYNYGFDVGVFDNGTAGSQYFWIGDNRNTERLRITSAGNVGIGTTSPTGAKLDIREDSANPIRWGSTSTQYGFTSWDTNLAIIGGIGASTNIGFWTNGNTERMRITSAGNVGIGTTSPSGIFEISKSNTDYLTTSAGHLILNNPSSTGQTSIYMQTNGTVRGKFRVDFNGDLAYVANGGAHTFWTGGDYSVGSERMRITSGGKLIVGATSDGNTGLVQIHGTARAVQLVASQGGITAGNYAIYGHDDDNGYINVVRSVYTGDFHFRFDGTTRATINRSTGVYVATSDINKKKDIEESKIGLSEVMQLKPTLYRMKVDSNESEKQLGFIAQDVKGIIPSAYHESGDFIGLNFNPIVAALTKAIQELKAELDILKTK